MKKKETSENQTPENVRADLMREALEPTARKLGKEMKPVATELAKAAVTVAQTVNVLLAPLRGLVWGWAQIEEKILPAVAERLKGVPKDRLQEPPMFLAGPTLESLRFAGTEQHLRELYVNLLATAMDMNTVRKAHPSFVEIIRQLTPDEARLLSFLNTVQRVDLSCPREQMRQTEIERVAKPAGCVNPELFLVYYGNLDRLGLASSSSVVINNHREMVLTPFGRQFCEACLPPIIHH